MRIGEWAQSRGNAACVLSSMWGRGLGLHRRAGRGALDSPVFVLDFTEFWGTLKTLQLTFVAFTAMVFVPEE